MPSPISYQAQPQNPGSFPIAPPRKPPKAVVPPLTPVVRNTPSMPVLPAHRKGPLPLPRQRQPQNGPPRSSQSSQSQSKRKPLSATSKDLSKKRSPLVLDRKQAVYNINNTIKKSSDSINNNHLPVSRQRSASDHNLKGNSMESRSLSKAKDDSQLPARNDNKQSASFDSADVNPAGIYEPVRLKGEIKGYGKPKRLEKDPDGRLYEVVQTRLVESNVSLNKDTTKLSNKRLSLPIVKSSTDSNIDRRKDCSQYLSNLFSIPSKAARLGNTFGGSESSDLMRDKSYNYYNKENIAKNINRASLGYPQDRPTQEVIERIKKNVEKKEEFLMRPNEPVWKTPIEEQPPIHRDYHVNPQKMQRHLWPPPDSQLPPSPGALTKALCSVLGSRGENQVLRRVKSEIEGPRTVSFPSAVNPSIEQFNEDYPLSHEARSNSLPNSPITTSLETDNQNTFPSVSYSSLPGCLNPLTGNIVAKPYGTHLNEDGTLVTKYARPFVSTLSRIHENIPSTCKDASRADPGTAASISTTATTTPIATPMGSQTSLSSQTATSSSLKALPLAWVSDNERIKQLQIVSTRAKKFETPNPEKEARKTAFHRFELSRLSQRANAFNVANRKKEFERRGSDYPAVNFEFGTSFDCSSRLKKFEDANWKGSKGVVKSLSDGGSFFAASREFCSLTEGSSSTPTTSIDTTNIQNTGNRMIPVGGPKIHCEPPDANDTEEGKPQNDSDVFKRNRANSTSHDALWTSTEGEGKPRRRSPLVRQHSFHSTLQAHLARAASSIQQRISASIDGNTHSSAGTPPGGAPVASGGGVSRRSKHVYGAGEDHDKLVRRVSYLKATSGDRSYSGSDSEEEKHTGGSPVTLARRAIRAAHPLSEELPSPASFLSSVSCNGQLHVKLAKLHGKRAGDRSWKNVWAVIRGRALLLYKDKHHASQTPLSPEDQVTLRGADAAVASDYTKRRHVFRLSTPAGSQFLLQADSEPSMTAWLNSITVAASQDVEPHAKTMTPTPENDTLSPYLDTAPVSMATTPTSSVSGSLCPPEAPVVSEGNVSPQLLPKNVKKITSPLRTKSPSGLASNVKSRKNTVELGSSPKSKTWKGRLGRHIRRMQGQGSTSLAPSSAPLPEGASIGVCLEDCPPSDENEFVPLLVSLCVGVVESKGLHIQGIYRIPGNRAAVTQLIDTVNRGPKAVDLSDTRWSDVNVISSLLKQFFQRLPDPLIPSDLYPHFIEASKLEDPQQRLVEIKTLLQDLPDHHYETLRFLCFHLNHVTSTSTDNKMDVRNLAIVFGPTLVRAADDNMAKMVTDMSHQCRIVEMLISQVNWFFNEEESDDPPPLLPTSGPHNSISGENSANASEREASSQSLLLGNVQKLEASQKDPKKLIVSSIISAANRRVQKVRKKVEEDSVHSRHDALPLHGAGYDALVQSQELPDPLPMSNRRISGSGVPSTASARSGSHRDARLFGDSCDPLLSKDDRLDSLDNLSTTASPITLGGTPTTTTATIGGLSSAPLSKSEPSHLGEDLAFKSYAGLSASTQERIRRFEMETRAMLQRDVTRHRRELLGKQKIEEELQRAKKDLETEDELDRLADNPSQVMHLMNDYCWPPNRETVSLPSLRPSAPSDPLKSHLAKSSLVPSADITNASAKDDKFSSPESGPQRQNHEGSDLLNAINATFEKMKTLQDSPLLHAEAEEADGRCPNSMTTGSLSDSHSHHQKEQSSISISDSNHSSNTDNNSSGDGTKCKLYRDPSLHRRRTFNAAIKQSSSSHAISYRDFGNQDLDTDKLSSEFEPMGYENDNLKEKSEKRTRKLLRTETRESLREKRPKELKRSNTQDTFRDSCLSSSGRERRDPTKSSSELKSRKHNVRELKEKFEGGSPPTISAVTAPLSNKSPTASSNEKVSRASLKQARKARIKRRHTVGGMKDLARVAWLKVIEAAHYADPHKVNQGCQLPPHSTQLPSWEQLQLFLEAFAEGRKMDVDTQALNTWVAKEKLGSSTPDLDSILSLVLPPQQKEALKRRLSVRECSVKPLHPVLESNV